MSKNKLRRSKTEDPLSITNVINGLKGVREDEQFFIKYFKQKQERDQNRQKMRKKVNLDLEDEKD